MLQQSQEIEAALAFARAMDWPGAITTLEKARVADQDKAEAFYHLAELAQKAGAYDEALHAGSRAVALAPRNPLAHLTLGLALTWLNRHEEALTAFQEAAKLEPRIALFWRNIGLSYQFQNKIDDAEKAFRTYIARNHDAFVDDDPAAPLPAESAYSLGYWDLALCDLLRGNLARGFARFRARFKAVPYLARPALPRPLWQGEDLEGQTILIHDEQGFGDNLMLARYIPLLKERGAQVRFAVHSALVPLYEGWDAVRDVTSREATIPLDFAYFASLFDLPLHFGTTLETIPADGPYLPVPGPSAATDLPAFDGMKIGIAWSGSKNHIYDAMRSMPLPLLAPLFKLPNKRFYSFAKDLRTGETAFLSAQKNVFDLSPHLHDFADTARFVQQMDLIITCDTALAHLAGGMGKQVWTLLPFAPDWRWLLYRPDTPWYPTMRLFRQTKSGDWASVITRVAHAMSDAR